MSDQDENDIPCLSSEALKALQEFISEQSLKTSKIDCEVSELIGTSEFDENWKLSQFWYDDETAVILSNEVCRIAGKTGKIGLVSCPTLYKHVKKLCPNNEVFLFEYDKRFSAYGSDFIYYDYNEPEAIPNYLEGAFDVVVLDPPYLSDECLEKTSITVKFLAKDKIILCTGACMEKLANKLLDVQLCKFKPKHKNNLGNDFSCYANYNFDDFIEINVT